MKSYREIFPEPPLIDSDDVLRCSAAELMSFEHFKTAPGSMPPEIFDEHHILINLTEDSVSVENVRDGELRSYDMQYGEIVITPAGIRSGWKWYNPTEVIVILIKPDGLQAFAQREMKELLGDGQLSSVERFCDHELAASANLILDALKHITSTSQVVFESLARVFLIKLIELYGITVEGQDLRGSFGTEKLRILYRFIEDNISSNITVESMANAVAMSPFHFSRLFKIAIGQTPHQFLTSYRINRSKEMLRSSNNSMLEISVDCGFSDQGHFSRLFKKKTGTTPRKWRSQESK